MAINTKNFRIQATTTFGLEAVVKREAADLGFKNITVCDGAVEFDGGFEEVARANLWLRCADKILIVMNRYKAVTFEELFDGAFEVPWDKWLPADAHFVITGKSVKSQLSSVPACQSIVEKAVIKRLQTIYDIKHFEKSGAEYSIQAALLKDEVTLTLNTSGPSLHKRGWRTDAVIAPLKETMAAALVMLSFWKRDRVLMDPCCGSGTILIEAAMIARNIAPGLSRKFAAEKWQIMPQEIWKSARKDAYSKIDTDFTPTIYGSDIDKKAIEIAKENAINAGVDDCMSLKHIPFNKLHLPCHYGICISNPPYAERMGELRQVEQLYRDMGRLFLADKTWSAYFITSHEGFEKLYGKRCDKKRKLYNGNVKIDYYQFYGERPPKTSEGQPNKL